MIFTLSILVIVVVLAGMSFTFYQRAKKLENQQKMLPGGESGAAGLLEGPRENVTIQNLRVGDIVSYFGQDFVIEGHLEYDEDGWTWDTYMLVDGDVVKWLSVEWDDSLEVSMWEEVDLEVGPNPPKTLTWAGETFTLDEVGSASVVQKGRTGRRQGVRVNFFEYEGETDRLLTVEKWGGDIEVSVGETINAYALEIYPGGGTSFD